MGIVIFGLVVLNFIIFAAIFGMIVRVIVEFVFDFIVTLFVWGLIFSIFGIPIIMWIF